MQFYTHFLLKGLCEVRGHNVPLNLKLFPREFKY
jgi:hypothetical protein